MPSASHQARRMREADALKSEIAEQIERLTALQARMEGVLAMSRAASVRARDRGEDISSRIERYEKK